MASVLMNAKYISQQLAVISSTIRSGKTLPYHVDSTLNALKLFCSDLRHDITTPFPCFGLDSDPITPVPPSLSCREMCSLQGIWPVGHPPALSFSALNASNVGHEEDITARLI